MTSNAPVAVVGMSGIFPGADTLDRFWHNIRGKVSSIIEVPEKRWIISPEIALSDSYMPDKAISRKAGLINTYQFDSYGFDIDHDFLEALDPMYHLVLGAGREALSQCAHTTDIKKRTGVILAAIALPTDTSSFVTRTILGKAFEKSLFGDKAFENVTPLSEATLAGARVTSLPASLLARALKLGGGTFTLDAACSSSLYSLKLACDELRSNRADMMLAGGVSRPEALFTQSGFSQLTALSPTGRCAPFDKNADGLVVGEGAGILVLKRLKDAIDQGDVIHGLICGAGLSNDIGGNLLAPDTEGQVRAMKNAYQKTGWSPFEVDHIECHGTGTPVGDTIELKSLKKVWGDTGWRNGQCAIGSIKSMTGHLLTAAGIAGTIKTLLAMKNKTIPPSLNFTGAAKNSPLNNGPFRVPVEPSDWIPSGKKRRAAVSAFGFGGTNAHVLFEEWSEKKPVHFVPDTIINKCDVAITGMGTFFDNAQNLSEFYHLLYQPKKSATVKNGTKRWNHCNESASIHMKGKPLPSGNYMTDFPVAIGEFHIPPNEIPDILPQHLMMLKASKMAMADSGISGRTDKPAMGLAIGMEFDYEATNFNFRWYLDELTEKWNHDYNLGMDKDALGSWTKKIKDSFSPPLTSSRTTGALGGIIASRVAKEFRFGGPCFIVSSEEVSGLKALEIGVRSIQAGETDTFLAGAVDLPGEIRNLVSASSVNRFSSKSTAAPFDENQDGTIPGEGAVAVVLKKAEQAIKDGDKIYAVIKGIGKASGEPEFLLDTCTRSLETAFSDAAIRRDTIRYVESDANGIKTRDKEDYIALHKFFSAQKKPVHLGFLTPYTGHTGAVSGLASLIKASIGLYTGVIPEAPHKIVPASYIKKDNILELPLNEVSFKGNVAACTGSIGTHGDVCHVVLEKVPGQGHEKICSLPDNGLPKAKNIMIKLTGSGYTPSTPPGYRENTQGENQQSTKSNIPKKAANKALIAEKITNGRISDQNVNPFLDTINAFTESIIQTAEAHSKFLEFSETITKNFADTLNFQSALIENAINTGNADVLSELVIDDPFTHDSSCANGSVENSEITDESVTHTQEPVYRDTSHYHQKEIQTGHQSGVKVNPIPEIKQYNGPPPAYSREMCMEFAVGSVAKVLGPEFAIVDSYPVRVRLPDEPLMLVDRIMHVEGKKGSLGSGKVITEHDVNENDWYLDGGKTPVCISIESGQADLFLCSYLGIDLAVKGKRSYRLLDAVATFHEGLPVPGDTIRYEINIEKFMNQGETYLFFFNFKGFIGNRHIITMRNGCAGFFTEKEVRESGGIILTPDEKKSVPGAKSRDFNDLVPFYNTSKKFSYGDDKINMLRHGNLEGAFGEAFKGKKLASTLWLPSGRMSLVDRVHEIDPQGGKYGIGSIRAEADIRPDAWFLKCHFVDDMVMPGTLMYECCMHTLRILAMRLGWVTDKEGVCIEPVPNVESELKCRGPVTVETSHVFYEVEIMEIGYNPEPYIIADAHMYAHEERIVMFKKMSLKFSGITKNEIENYWKKGNAYTR